jgi:small subunit ribosomal protein S19e
MATIYDVEINKLLEKASEDMKKVSSIHPPDWSKFVKTGVHKERPPVKSDWWYMRAAAILRRLYILGPIGVSKLRTKYGGRKRRGFKPERFMKGSGNIIRKILQQLEKAGFAKQMQKGTFKGRVITPQGKSFLDKAASQLYVKHTPKHEAEEETVAKAPQEAEAAQ